MSIGLESDVFTAEITNDTLTIVQNMGVQQISIYNSSAISGTVTGSRSLGSTVSSSLTIIENQTVTFKAIDASVIESLTIVAPSGCTLQIIAQ